MKPSSSAFILMLVGSLWLQGCGPKSTGLSDGRSGAIDRSTGKGRIIDPIQHPIGTSASGWVQTAIQPLGSVPHDNMTLPLVSPDGRFVATQVGIPPKWQTLLAEAGAELPILTKVEIYALDRREGVPINELQPPKLVAPVADLVLLGRSCDEKGFLVESPREDGSRWIGKVSWQDGSLSWLVDGADVNAFASLGPNGQLAWCRRPVGSEHFDLMVRTASGEWKAPSGGDEWLMPSWSGRDNGLFVLYLQGQKLRLCFAPATSGAAFQGMLQTLSIVNDANIYHAYQAVIGQSGATAPASIDQLAYFHPGVKQMALWRPMAQAGKRVIALWAGSTAALMDNDQALVSLDQQLISQSIRNLQFKSELLNGFFVPRSTAASRWPYMLMAPNLDRVSLTAFRLIPPEESTGTASTAR